MDIVNRAVAILFAIACLVTSFASASILGVGMWFWIITAPGMFVAVSQFVPALRGFGGVAASLLAAISVIAVVFTLLAATVGGSFKLDSRETLLVFGFFMIVVLGFLLARVNKRSG